MDSSSDASVVCLFVDGFTLRSVLSEFRALRATILRLYAASGASDLIDVLRFNEAIDEANDGVDGSIRGSDRPVSGSIHRRPQPRIAYATRAVTAGAALLTLPEDNPQRRSWVVTRIMNSAQRMERMIGDFLDVTRARLGGSCSV